MARFLVVLILIGTGFVLMTIIGLDKNLPVDGQEKPRTPFAGDRVGVQNAKEITPASFDGKRAMGYLQSICEIGPRMSATPGMKKQQELIRKHFEKLDLTVESQTFSAKQVSRPSAVEMRNLIVSFHPEKKRRIILCSHYDTRPIADQERDPRKWGETFVSANDGGSGVAFLMELAHHMKDLPLNVGVDFVFFDGEEYIFDNREDRDQYFFGSKHFAKAWAKNKKQPNYLAAVLLDMIAGENARFPHEGHSWFRYQELCKDIWRVAADVGAPAFQNRVGVRVNDDHIALQNVGIPAIDIIDFDYAHWHKLSDTPENCSADSMIQVARVLSIWMQRLK